MSRYVITGGKAGKDRLKLLSQVLLPTTSQLFKTAGIGEGMKCLDMGCGGGFVTLLLADLVGPGGKVIGADADAAILALAREDADAGRRGNVEFRQADALVCQGEEEYDLVYARCLLTHLSEPEKCLGEMIKACKPNGVVVIEDIDFTGSFCHPYSSAYQRYTELYQEVVRRRGGDANVGPKLPGMLRRAGVTEIQVGLAQPAHIEGEGKFMASITMARIADAVLSEQLATEDEVGQVIAELNDAAADPEFVIGFPRIFQVWGKRA
jgi:ubiquinone/menaquinone biosynthesis C-methylase UbiE